MSTKTKAEPSAVEELSFELALKELEDIVARLEQGEVDLEDSIALYERGQGLKAHCEKKLKAAESRLEKIVHGAGGPVGSEFPSPHRLQLDLVHCQGQSSRRGLAPLPKLGVSPSQQRPRSLRDASPLRGTQA